MRGGLLLTCFWVWLWLIGPFNFTVTIWPTIEQKRLQSAEQLYSPFSAHRRDEYAHR